MVTANTIRTICFCTWVHCVGVSPNAKIDGRASDLHRKRVLFCLCNSGWRSVEVSKPGKAVSTPTMLFSLSCGLGLPRSGSGAKHLLQSRHYICRALLEQPKRSRIRHAVSASSLASVSHCAFAAHWHFTRRDWGSFSSVSQRSVLEVVEAAPSVQ